jgi:hypothetical protein
LVPALACGLGAVKLFVPPSRNKHQSEERAENNLPEFSRGPDFALPKPVFHASFSKPT